MFLGAGRIDASLITDGSNIIVLTYDLVLNSDTLPNSTLDNTATLLGFSALSGGVDYTDGTSNSDWTDDASVATDVPAISKDLLSTGIVDATNALNRAVAGEYITYSVEITIPEGTLPAAQLRDNIDADVRFDQIVSVTPSSADVTTDLAGGFAGVVAPASGTAGNVFLDLGNITTAIPITR